MSPPVSLTDPLVTRGAAMGIFAALFGPDSSSLAAGTELGPLQHALEELGDAAAADAVAALAARAPFDADALSGLRSRLFELGRVPPYETSHVPSGLGGNTAPLADIAGFYRAFGFQVAGERPDHCVVELEFGALLTLAEADARRDADTERAEVYADAARMFVRDHLGGWLDLLATKLAEADPDGPYALLAEAASLFLAREADRRGVIIVRSASFGPGIEGDFGAADDGVPECGADVPGMPPL